MGEKIVHWVWGGLSVSNATLNSFYSLHYLLPFILVGLMGVHLFFYMKGGLTTHWGFYPGPIV